MFHHIRGELAHVDTSFVVIDCGGVGYRMTVSLLTADSLSGRLGSEVKLLAHLQVREDSVELFGFGSKEELETFQLLITVSGVGPKVATGILSAFSPENFAALVCAEDAKSLAKAPGVGAKTAARIVLELKEKISGSAISALPTLGGRTAAAPRMSGKLSEAAEALIGLGFSRAEVTDVIRTLDTTNMTREDIVTAALKRFAKPQ
ncbi:MAG: Holliday junction branch migration protein RuvA [Clostridia bacterium]|nr:Holliday junction branch migration protein RuvA [Clostridia bacterium]